jgi:hypothetical protein
MVDNAQSGLNEWFELTDTMTGWEDQINKLKEDLSEFFEGTLDFDPVKKFKVEEEVFNKV